MANSQPKKKILYFVPQFPVLTETFIESEISKLISFGNLDIEVFSLAPGSGKLSDNVKDHVHYEKLTMSIALRSFFTYVVKSPRNAMNVHSLVLGEDKIPYLINLKKDNDPRTKLSVLGRFHRSRFIHFLKGVAYTGMIAKYNPDHIHANFLSDSSTVALVAAKLLKVPFSVAAHAIDVFVEGTLIPVKAKEAKFIVICNGNTWREVIDQANRTKSSGKVRLLFHGVPLDKLNNAKKLSRFDVPYIFTIARLVEKKGLKYLIEASKILKQREVKHKIGIAGGGPLYEELIEYIKLCNVEDCVEILGENKGVANDLVMSHLKIADIYCAPFIKASSGDMDGVPYSMLEAAFAKLPIITTNAGSIGDLVTSENGIIVPQKDSAALANALENLIKDSNLRSSLSEKVYKAVISKFDIDKNVKEMEALFLA